MYRSAASEAAHAVRLAEPSDVPELVRLLGAYMQETYARPWSGSAASLERDGFGAEFQTVVAGARGTLTAFACWRRAYDLHHCVAGGEVMDVFVMPEHRARGVVAAVLARVAAAIRDEGGAYLSGQAVQGGVTERMYRRYAMCFPGPTCVLGGRAFRELASLAGETPRNVVARMPPHELNFEP